MHNGIVDTHLHIWDLKKVPIPWLAPGAPTPPGFDTSSFAKDYLPEDYQRDTGGRIVGAVYVPVSSADW